MVLRLRVQATARVVGVADRAPDVVGGLRDAIAPVVAERDPAPVRRRDFGDVADLAAPSA